MPSPNEQFQDEGVQLKSALLTAAPKAVAVYGLGVVAKNVLSSLESFNVVGLMDKDDANLGKTFYGKRVLSFPELLSSGVQAIVIAASEMYWRIIASRISGFCAQNGIRIYYLNGELACNTDSGQNLLINQTRSRAELEDEVAKHDVVSFDLFETLVTRFASRPDDILELAALRTSGNSCSSDEMLAARKSAEFSCRNQFGAFKFGLEAVYQTIPDLSERITAALHQNELRVEQALSVPRQAVLHILRKCRASGKQVCIVTDTHLPRDTIEAIIHSCALGDVPALYMSCEQGLSKAHNGELFELVKQEYPGLKILHIGDNAESDERNARAQGLSSFRISSPAELLGQSRLKTLLVLAKTTQDGLLIGMLSRKLFDDPFSSLDPDGRVAIRELKTFGYIVFGPLLLTYVSWLVSKLREKPAEKLLFFAREGYFLSRLFNEIREAYGLNDLPVGEYFATSRRMASVASLRTKTDALTLLRDKFSGSPEQLLRLRFGLEKNNPDSDGLITNSDARAVSLVEASIDQILDNASDERNSYLRYIDELGIRPDTRVAVADLGIKGSIQYALERMLGRSFDGYYVTGFFGAENPYGMRENTSALFVQSRAHGQHDAIYLYHLLCESVLVAPEGMYGRAKPEGGFVNAAQKKNQEFFEAKAQIHSGIREFISDWQRTGISLENLAITPALIDASFALAMSDSVIVDESIKSVLYVDELYSIESEKRIWD